MKPLTCKRCTLTESSRPFGVRRVRRLQAASAERAGEGREDLPVLRGVPHGGTTSLNGESSARNDSPGSC
jgi:hypothetical protein